MPKSINILSIVVIVFSVIGLAGLFSSLALLSQIDMAAVGMSKSLFMVAIVVGFVGIAINLACAWFWRKGQNWARQLYIAATVISMVVGFVAGMSTIGSMIPGLVVFAVVVFFLYRPDANAFFAANS